jgi:hypothetical protein
MSSNDITYTTGNPDYDSGADLTTGTSTGLTYGTYRGEVARHILRCDGVRIMWTTDSQGSGGTNRALSAIALTWEPDVPWSSWPAYPTALDPWYCTDSSSSDQYHITSGWNSTSASITGGGGDTVTDMLGDEGLGDISQIPLVWHWNLQDDTGTSLGSISSQGYDDPATKWFHGADQWGSDSNPVYFSITQMHLFGGSSRGPSDIRISTQYYDGPSALETDTEDFSDLSTIVESHTLNLSNNEAVLAYTEVGPYQNYASQASFRPTSFVGERPTGEDFEDKSRFLFGGIITRYSDASTPEDTIGITLNRYGAGMNPCAWLHGATLSASGRFATGGDYGARAFVFGYAKVPTVLAYSFGHNDPTRTGTGFKAESTFQADYFDLIWQDYRTVVASGGDAPYVLVVIPWYAGSMDQDRHDEIIGMVDALEAHGVKVMVDDKFNRYDGEDFTTTGTPSSEYKTATTFELDGDNDPEGSGVHPANAASANIAWYSTWAALGEASLSYASGMRSRDRSRER